MPPKTRAYNRHNRLEVIGQPTQSLIGFSTHDARQEPEAIEPTMPPNAPHVCRVSDAQDDSPNIIIEQVCSKRKRVRGPTCMPKVWGQPQDDLISVSFNNFGQPNDDCKTSTLAHFLGTIARNGRYCPLHYKDWRLMPYTYKEEMLKIVKTKFELMPRREVYILKSINKKWRNWKSYVKSLNFDPNIPIEEQMLNVPDRVDEEQYRALIEHWRSDKFQRISGKNKETRAQLELFHRMGKKSFALVKEIMKKKLGKYPTRAELFEECYYREDGSSTSAIVQEALEQMKEMTEQESQTSTDDVTNPIRDDAYAKVMGADKYGHVRMYGMGVTPADVYGAIPSRDASYRMALEYKDKYQHIADKYDALNEKLENLTAIVHERSQVDEHSNNQGAPPASQNNHSASQNNHPSSRSMTQPRRIRVKSYVVLKSLGNINEIVASGYVNAMNQIRVNGEELGSEWCEITIQSIMKRDVRLLKPFDHIQTIGDTLGAPIAWPLSLVALDEDRD